MNTHPIYERPREDQGREKRTVDWNKSEILNFLESRYEDPLEEFGVDNYEELKQRIDEIGLEYDEETDWRNNQVPDLGVKNYDWGIACGVVRLEEGEERSTKPDYYVPWEVTFEDENGEVQIEYDNR